MATQDDITQAVIKAAAEYRLSRRAARLLHIALEILVFEIGPPESITDESIQSILYSDTAKSLLEQGDRGKLGSLLNGEDGRTALAMLRILSHPEYLYPLVARRLPDEAAARLTFLLDKD